MYLLVVNDSIIDTKNIASSYVGVCKGDKTGLTGRQPSTHFLCTLQGTKHYFRPSFDWFQIFSCFFGYAVRVNKLFINFTDALLLGYNKIQEIIIFYSSFLKSVLIT